MHFGKNNYHVILITQCSFGKENRRKKNDSILPFSDTFRAYFNNQDLLVYTVQLFNWVKKTQLFLILMCFKFGYDQIYEEFYNNE